MLYETLIQLIKYSKSLDTTVCSDYFDYVTYLKEFRTINCSLPRQSGKTTILNKLHKNTSSLLFNKYRIDSNSNSIESFQYAEIFRGRKTYGLKYSFILLDEYPEVPDQLYKMIQFLRVSKLIADDLMIVGLHTR